MEPEEECQGPRGNITQYRISFDSESSVNLTISNCTARRCSHPFVPPSNSPSSYDRVSIAAENVAGVGNANNLTTQPISELNFNYYEGIIVSCIVVS